MTIRSPTLDLLPQLKQNHTELRVKRSHYPPHWPDSAAHQAAYQAHPTLYALLALMPTITAPQQAKILLKLLQTSRRGLAVPERQLCERLITLLLAILPTESVLTVFLALRRLRANHKHTTRAILSYLLNHPALEDLIGCRRPTVRDCLEHALGKNVARACLRMLSTGVIDHNYLHSHLLKFAIDPNQAKALLPRLCRSGTNHVQPAPIPRVDTLNRRDLDPQTVTATNRGEIAATLVHLYRGGPSEILYQALAHEVAAAVATLPYYPGSMALVLDTSASTRSYGEREYCTLSQSVALQLVLSQCTHHLETLSVDTAFPPRPQGATDLALDLLEAVAKNPDLVIIISDGYENTYPGDLESVAAALPKAGITTPIVYCHSKFSNADDLSLRQPTSTLPQLEFWHQADFEDVLLTIFACGPTQTAEACFSDFLMTKLTQFETRLGHLKLNQEVKTHATLTSLVPQT